MMEICRALRFLVFLAWMNASFALAQDRTLKELAERKGFEVGFELSPENIQEAAFLATVTQEASVGTFTTYWYLPNNLGLDRGPVEKSLDSKSPRGNYDFSRPESVLRFCESAGLTVHGHALLWPQDQFNPPWVLKLPANKARAALGNHIQEVVGKFRGQVETWHVVNELFDYRGTVIDSYWSRNLGFPKAGAVTPTFVDIAFRYAAKADPDARLIYNDYGQEESDPRKFNAIRNMMVDMRRRGIPIHGMGWQLHQTATTVLDPAFQLEARMNAMAELGFDNYITELDIVMDDRKIDGSLNDPKPKYSAADLQRQKWAYKKVFEIFARVKRRVSVQTWGVSDKQSWLGANRAPLLFDANFGKKPAYYGVQEALVGEISGLRTMQSLWDQRFLLAGSTTQNAPLNLVQAPPRKTAAQLASWSVPLWELTCEDGNGSYRLKLLDNNRYLQVGQDAFLPPATTGVFSQGDSRQNWYLIPCGHNTFLILNRANCATLQPNYASLSKHPLVVGPRRTWWLGFWKIE